jgi:hypothetical protein
MSDLTLDGNGVAGLLDEVFGNDMTTVVRICLSCGVAATLGAHRAYRGPGMVLRCPACADLAIVIVSLPDRYVVQLRGALQLEMPR